MTTYRDPRLTDPVLLALAARRWQHRQAQPQGPDWQEVDGLCALLQHAARLGPQAVPEVHAHDTGMARLLWECRQQTREPGA